MADAALAVETTRTLRREQVAEAAGVSPDVVKAWTKDHTLAPEFYWRDGDNAYRYHPASVAAFELGHALARRLGPKNPVMKPVLRKVGADLINAWATPDVRRRLVIRFDGYAVLIPLSCVASARAKVAALGD